DSLGARGAKFFDLRSLLGNEGFEPSNLLLRGLPLLDTGRFNRPVPHLVELAARIVGVVAPIVVRVVRRLGLDGPRIAQELGEVSATRPDRTVSLMPSPAITTNRQRRPGRGRNQRRRSPTTPRSRPPIFQARRGGVWTAICAASD